MVLNMQNVHCCQETYVIQCWLTTRGTTVLGITKSFVDLFQCIKLLPIQSHILAPNLGKPYI